MTSGFVFRSLRNDGVDMPYVVYVPRGYTPDRDWPTIVFLHGSGECGTDGLKHVAQGLGPAVMWDEAKWPFVVVMPQKPDSKLQWEDYDAAVMGMLAATAKEYRVDASRTYLTGLSQGGHGTWALGARHPETWAALVPICGYVVKNQPGEKDVPAAARAIAEKIKGVPVWAFHGEADDIVKPEQTRIMMEALKAAGGTADQRATYYPGVNHNSWDKAYREEKAEGGVAAWLLKQKR